MIEQILDVTTGELAISHALEPDLKERLLRRAGTRELPCVRGRTVVPEAFANTVVAGYPNYLGVFDEITGARSILLTNTWSRLRPLPADTTAISIEEAATPLVASDALEEVRRLTKRLRQLKGVQLAIRPQSPIIVALLPFSPGLHALALPGVTALGDAFPEYPGGIRIEPPTDAAGFDLTRSAADLEQAIMEEV